MTKITSLLLALTVGAFGLSGQDIAPAESEPPKDLIPREEPPPEAVTLPRGTRVPLALINSISSKNSAPGDKLYLQSVYPVAVEGRILVPPGTYVTGIVTEVQRPGRIKGRGLIRVKFEQMILPNGTIRDFTGSLAALDGASEETLNRETSEVKSAGGKGEDAQTVGDATRTGSTVGVLAGAAGGRPLRGLGLGAAGGAAAGLAGVLLTRGPDAVLERGTQLDMVLDRDLFFTEAEVTFQNALQAVPQIPVRGAQPQDQDPQRNGGIGFPQLLLGG